MKINKILVFLMIISILGTIFVYSSLPERIPGHFNFKGEVDRYDDKISVFFTALLPLAIYLLMLFLPKIDPKRKSYQKHKKAYDISKTIMVIFMVMLHWVIILYSLGFNIDVGIIVRVGVGILFIVLGNFMSQIRHNYFFGIKTPWTLSNETVWKKTHRVGAFSFIVAGLIMIASSPFSGIMAQASLITAIAVAALYPIVYSYIVYRKISKE
ncbi:SdpI family protein [Wukongibacter baidiensis]|uniref:SdpI family protein n=1 Tax=Wukongibacter baidiensis TaxID=1723361 RepID=UPI003D7FE117